MNQSFTTQNIKLKGTVYVLRSFLIKEACPLTRYLTNNVEDVVFLDSKVF